MLINSPNNPTGRVYPAESLAALGDLLRRKSDELGRIIYLVSDEPYRRIVYDGHHGAAGDGRLREHHHRLQLLERTVAGGGEDRVRGGQPGHPGCRALMEGLTMANRILGFVNAPALMQRAVARLQGVSVDVAPTSATATCSARRCRGGFRCVQAPGRLLSVPASPIEDDVAFCREMQQHLVLVVPGSGFGAARATSAWPTAWLRRWSTAPPGLPADRGQVLRKLGRRSGSARCRRRRGPRPEPARAQRLLLVAGGLDGHLVDERLGEVRLRRRAARPPPGRTWPRWRAAPLSRASVLDAPGLSPHQQRPIGEAVRAGVVALVNATPAVTARQTRGSAARAAVLRPSPVWK